MRKLLFLQAVLGIILLCLVVLACTPPFDRDGLIHHLQVPKLYLQHGGIYEIPELPFSYYPMNLDLLYMGALYFGSDILPKYIHMAFAFATALLLFFYLKKRLPIVYAWLGAIFFLSVPVIVKLSVTVYVDLGLVFFSTAALLLLFRWLETKRRRDLLLAGFSCGLGIGTKYNGLLVLFILTLIVPILFIRSHERRRQATAQAVKSAAFFCLTAVFAVSPWLIRNAVWTGNPVYPLYKTIFSPAVVSQPAATETKAEKQEKSGVRGIFATRYVLYGENIWQLLLLPLRVFFEGRDDDPRYFDGRLNPFLFLLPLLAFSHRPTDRSRRIEQIALAAFCLLYFLYAFNLEVLRIRYLVPIVPFLVILSMHGLHNLEILATQHLQQRRVAMSACLLPTVLLLAWNGSYIYQQFEKIAPFSYISGQLNREEYLVKQLPEYPLLQHINKQLPNSAKILCVFMGWRGYYIDRTHLFDYPGNSELLIAWLQKPSMTADTIMQHLKNKNITHLLVREDFLEYMFRQKGYNQQMLWNTTKKKYTYLVSQYDVFYLYQLKLDK